MERRYGPQWTDDPAFNTSDVVILLAIAAALTAGVRLGFTAPRVTAVSEISLAPAALPWYAALSLARMSAAYALSFIFALAYGTLAFHHRTARLVLMPLLDVLQSIPILSFLPVVVLGLSAVLPETFAAELASIVLIFTSQAWNMTFSFYQSLSTVPTELREAAAVFRLDRWLRFKTLELPYAAIGLIWNSMMSWSGGWFFLMAAEVFHVGTRNFRLPGLGAYLQTAASAGNIPALLLGLLTLIAIIVTLDQLAWRPLIAWSHKFKLEMIEGEAAPTSWFLNQLARSWLLDRAATQLLHPLSARLDDQLRRHLGAPLTPPRAPSDVGSTPLAFRAVVGVAILYGAVRATELLGTLPAAAWTELLHGIATTSLRVLAVLVLTLLWTLPVGVAIGTNRRIANILQPLVQVAAAIPATALFPIILLALLGAPGGLNIAAIALMLLGAQWYMLFNIIAGAAAIPLDLLEVAQLLRLSRLDRWRTLILPALFPYIVTGAITASGGAWNSCIVAEYVEFGGRTHTTTGIGASLAKAAASADNPLLLAATLTLVATVVIINRTAWRALHRLAERRYRLD